MGTNYYRIANDEELKRRRGELKEVSEDIDEDGLLFGIHLGKRSAGWLFLWNFHNHKYYSNKEELFKYIRRGTIVDEYCRSIDTEEFIKMALEWCQPDGLCGNEMHYIREYDMKGLPRPTSGGLGIYDEIVEGLVVCESTEFC